MVTLSFAIYEDPKSLNLTANAMLALSFGHLCGLKKLPGSIPTGGNFFVEFILLSSTEACIANFHN